MKTLLVLGATGEMGRRIVRLSRRLLPGVRVGEGSRRANLDNPDHRQVDLHDRMSLARALVGVDAIINAVGPFEYDPALLVGSCLDAGCHYVDIAETADFLIGVASIDRDRPTGVRRASVLGGCSTIPGLVEVLAQAWVSRLEVSRVRVFLSMGSANPVTPTLLFSLLRPLGTRSPDGSRYFDRLTRKTPKLASTRLYGRFPSTFETLGLRLGSRILPATLHAGLDRDTLDRFLWLASRILPTLSTPVLMRACRMVCPLMTPLRRLGTTVGVLAIEAINEAGTLLDEIDVRADREGLDIPALPAVWAVRQLLFDDRSSEDATCLDQLIKPEQAASWLRQEGYIVQGI